VLRGECDFETKMNNAQAAGAAAIIVYTTTAQAVGVMSAGGATLPGVMIANADGISLKRQVAAGEVTVTLRFWNSPVDPNQVARFSSRGPTLDFTIKPDLVAVGANLVTATQKSNSSGELFRDDGLIVINGTSFSAPMVAGAAAVLKEARPGLMEEHYRSLLINSASPLLVDGKPAPVQQAGTGVLNLDAALRNTVVASPTSINFGIEAGDQSRDLVLRNVGVFEDTFTVSITSLDSSAPQLSTSIVTLAPGRSSPLTLTWPGSGLVQGAYQGFLTVRGVNTDVETRIAYWRAVPSRIEAQISIPVLPMSGQAGSPVRLYYRVTDQAGISLFDPTPRVTAVSGGGEVLGNQLLGGEYPGLYECRVRLGPARADNVFRIEAGSLEREIVIQGVLPN
jgi:subtilisin family serine protease